MPSAKRVMDSPGITVNDKTRKSAWFAYLTERHRSEAGQKFGRTLWVYANYARKSRVLCHGLRLRRYSIKPTNAIKAATASRSVESLFRGGVGRGGISTDTSLPFPALSTARTRIDARFFVSTNS